MKLLAFVLLLTSNVLATQLYPGTASRPFLSAGEVSIFKKSDYLQGWTPPTLLTNQVDYTVGAGGFSSIQAAVNAAINDKGTTRKYIKINPGTYNQVVYIPNTKVPLTIYGAGSSPSDTVISLSLSATLSGAAYTSLVGSLFASGDPAYNIYQKCASTVTTIGTSCSTVFLVQAPNVQIINLTIENSSKNTGTDQAVALKTAADQIQVDNCRLLGHQDTLYSGNAGTAVQRCHMTSTYIEGDVDFVFGGGSTVFESCTFHALADRTSNAMVFAPCTHPDKLYGYLAVQCTFTGDSAYFTSKRVSLARAWDTGVSSTSAYVVGSSPNGQLVIRESTIDGVVNNNAPYLTATSGRVYSGNISPSRNLDDNNFNRFWEFVNTGVGA